VLLQRVIVNVLANARRYAPPGTRVRIASSRLGPTVELRIVDHGPGVSADRQDDIFTPFQRLGDTDNTTGLGLGLALSKGFTEGMGGTLTPETTPGGGLTMVVSLPVDAAASDLAAPPAPRREDESVKILVADDDPQLVRALRITLAAHGYDVIAAPDGAAAIAAAAQARPDVVMLDLGMPRLDGIEVIHALRGWTDVPILVVSGRTGSADKVEALDAGADDYVTKPFQIDELLARLRALARRRGVASAASADTLSCASAMSRSTWPRPASSAAARSCT
jgi:CheY-like chemotaxis protein